MSPEGAASFLSSTAFAGERWKRRKMCSRSKGWRSGDGRPSTFKAEGKSTAVKRIPSSLAGPRRAGLCCVRRHSSSQRAGEVGPIHEVAGVMVRVGNENETIAGNEVGLEDRDNGLIKRWEGIRASHHNSYRQRRTGLCRRGASRQN